MHYELVAATYKLLQVSEVKARTLLPCSHPALQLSELQLIGTSLAALLVRGVSWLFDRHFSGRFGRGEQLDAC